MTLFGMPPPAATEKEKVPRKGKAKKTQEERESDSQRTLAEMLAETQTTLVNDDPPVRKSADELGPEETQRMDIDDQTQIETQLETQPECDISSTAIEPLVSDG